MGSRRWGACVALMAMAVEGHGSAEPEVRPRVDPITLVAAVTNGRGFTCSGVLISSRHVLTARHCGVSTNVLFGESIDRPTHTVAVDRIVTPPFLVDAEILVLRQPVPLSVTADVWIGEEPPVGEAVVLGFGAVDPDGTRGAGVRRSHTARIAGWGCTPERAAVMGCFPGYEMVLTRQSGGDSCRGDSGGPVFLTTSSGPKLLAIVSRATNEAGAWCGDGGVYVRADALAGWLERVVEGK